MAWDGGEPEENDVSLLCDIIGVNRPEATKRLKANNRNVEQAANEFFENPDSTKYRWDESAWTGDREGNTNAAGIQFNVQGPDVTNSYFDHGSAAPTRPNSRTNNRSPLGGPTTVAEEDADLLRALAESAAESGVAPQESGILGPDVNKQAFGPATRSEYEQDQWAMVPTKESTQQKPELAPSARKRSPGAPAFLRGKTDDHLAGIVTILHAIPSARNALLSSGQSAKNYGFISDWWKGQPILKKESLDAMARDEWIDEQHRYPDFNDELHRLMAFLDSTDRAYGAVDGLPETHAIDPYHGNGWGSVDHEEAFFQVLAEQDKDKLECEPRPFKFAAKTERVLPRPVAKGPSEENEAMSNSESADDDDQYVTFNFLQIGLEFGQNAWVTTLYDALDTVFWSNALSEDTFPDENSNTALVTELGDILTIRIGGDGLCQPCDVPPFLYLDRYHKSRKDMAVSIQTQIHDLRGLLNTRIKNWEQQYLTCRGETGCRQLNWFDGKPHAARECWEKLIKTSELRIKKDIRRAQMRYTGSQIAQGHIPTFEDVALIHAGNAPWEPSENERVVRAKLERVIEIAREKLDEIDDAIDEVKYRRELCYHGLRNLSRWLTVREDEATSEFVQQYITPDKPQYYKPECWNPTLKYFLRGVATTKEITYVCTRREADLIELDDTQPQSDQWWKLAYAANEANPMTVEKTDIETVLIAAGTESKFPVMVYTSEAAIKATPSQLSDALRMFVRADNRAFQNELSQEETQPQSQIQLGSPPVSLQGDGTVPLTADAIKSIPSAMISSPSKRKHSSGASSVATIDSTDSRDLEMAFSDPPDPFNTRDGDFRPGSMAPEFASPTPQPNKLGGLVESLENCRTYEQGSPVLGRRDLAASTQNQELQDFGVDGSATRSPEMQERTGGPSMFVNRPVEKASQVAPVDLMDMDIDVEHHEG